MKDEEKTHTDKSQTLPSILLIRDIDRDMLRPVPWRAKLGLKIAWPQCRYSNVPTRQRGVLLAFFLNKHNPIISDGQCYGLVE